jgi:hypothetical protein
LTAGLDGLICSKISIPFLGQSYFRDKNGRGKHEKALSNEMS